MENHVRALGLIYILMGVFGALTALCFFLVFNGVSILGDYMPARGFAIVGLMALLLLLAVPSVWIGMALLQFKPQARTLGTILSTLQLMNVPAGTLVGIYGLWVLMSAETDPLFSPRFDTSRE